MVRKLRWVGSTGGWLLGWRRRSGLAHGASGTVPARERSRAGAIHAFTADELFQQVLAELCLVRQRDGVLAVETGRAQPARRLLAGLDQPFQRDVTQRVGADGPSYPVHVEITGHQLGPAGE